MITSNQFSSTLKNLRNTAANVQSAAEFAIYQAATGGNVDYLKRVFAALSVQGGQKLSAEGARARTYVLAHYRAIKIETKPSATSRKGEVSPVTIAFKAIDVGDVRRTHIALPGQRTADGEQAFAAKSIADGGLKLADYAGFKAAKAATSEPKPVSAGSVINALKKAVELGIKFPEADIDTAGELLRLAAEIQAIAQKNVVESPTKGDTVDLSRLEELASVKPQQSKRVSRKAA